MECFGEGENFVKNGACEKREWKKNFIVYSRFYIILYTEIFVGLKDLLDFGTLPLLERVFFPYKNNKTA